jgi:hypothetical protein
MVSSDCMGRNLCVGSTGRVLFAYKAHSVVKFIDGVGIKSSSRSVPLMQSVALKEKQIRQCSGFYLESFDMSFFYLSCVHRSPKVTPVFKGSSLICRSI